MSITNAIQKALANIGTAYGTAFPELRKGSNVDTIKVAAARELFFSDNIRSYGNKRYEVAKDRASDLGLLAEFDNMLPGSGAKVLFDGGGVSLIGQVNNPSPKLDEKKLANELTVLLGAAKAQALLKKCYKETKAPRIIKPVLSAD